MNPKASHSNTVYPFTFITMELDFSSLTLRMNLCQMYPQNQCFSLYGLLFAVAPQWFNWVSCSWDGEGKTITYDIKNVISNMLLAYLIISKKISNTLKCINWINKIRIRNVHGNANMTFMADLAGSRRARHLLRDIRVSFTFVLSKKKDICRISWMNES